MLSGKVWLKVPSAIKFNLIGKPDKYISGKDVILHIIGMIGVDGALYKSIEFAGEGVKYMTMDDRFTICNMAIECGAKNGVFPVDDITEEYVKVSCGKTFDKLEAGDDDAYEQVIDIDLSAIRPTVAFPHLPSNTKAVEDVKEDIAVDQVVIGSCTNGRLSDLEQAARVLKGRKVNPNVRTIISPATNKIYLEAMEKGLSRAAQSYPLLPAVLVSAVIWVFSPAAKLPLRLQTATLSDVWAQRTAIFISRLPLPQWLAR